MPRARFFGLEVKGALVVGVQPLCVQPAVVVHVRWVRSR